MDAVFGMFIPWGGNMGGGRPDNSLPGGPPAHPWYPGHGGPGHPSGGPVPPEIWPPRPPVALPPGISTLPIIPPDAPPGTIWPPLPPDVSLPPGKYAVLVWVSGHGARYAVVEVAQPK